MCNILHWTTVRDFCLELHCMFLSFFLEFLLWERCAFFYSYLRLVFSSRVQWSENQTNEGSSRLVCGYFSAWNVPLLSFKTIHRCEDWLLPLHDRELMDAQIKDHTEVIGEKDASVVMLTMSFDVDKKFAEEWARVCNFLSSFVLIRFCVLDLCEDRSHRDSLSLNPEVWLFLSNTALKILGASN